MPAFLASEKERLIPFKATSHTFSAPARANGCYKGHAYPFCLPVNYAHENLEPSIRDTIRAYFRRNAIKWHDGQAGNPSNHLCDSQVCCANFLFPFADKPAALAALLRPLFPQFMRQQFLAHEMEQAGELDADVVSLLHIAPRRNEDFRRITAPALQGIADSATGVWSRLVAPADRFRSIYTEDLFGPFGAGAHPALSDWKAYIAERYDWITSSKP